MTVDINIDIFKISNDHNLTIVNLQRLHRYLNDAINHLTSYYNPQLLCWIACILIDIITFIFASLYENTENNNMLLICSRCMMILYLSFQVIAISHICHLTCNQVLVYNMLMNKIDIITFLTSHKIILGKHIGEYNILSRGIHIKIQSILNCK